VDRQIELAPRLGRAAEAGMRVRVAAERRKPGREGQDLGFAGAAGDRRGRELLERRHRLGVVAQPKAGADRERPLMDSLGPQ